MLEKYLTFSEDVLTLDYEKGRTHYTVVKKSNHIGGEVLRTKRWLLREMRKLLKQKGVI